MFMLGLLSLCLCCLETFASDNSDNLRDNLRTIRIDFNKILEDIETLAEDVIVKAQESYQFNADDIHDYNWNDDVLTTSTTKSFDEALFSLNSKKLKDVTQHHLKRPKRSIRQKSVDTIQKTIDNPLTSIHYTEDEINHLSSSDEETKHLFLKQRNDHIIESTTHRSDKADQKEKVICTIRTQNQIDTEKQKLDDLKEEMKKLNELVSLLKDQQHFFREHKLWERPKLKQHIGETDVETKMENIYGELPDESTNTIRDEKKTELDKLKTEIREVLKHFDKTKIRESFIESELNKHGSQIKEIQEKVDHLYNKFETVNSNTKSVDDIASRANNVEDIVVGSPLNILNDITMTKGYNPTLHRSKDLTDKIQNVPIDNVLNKFKHNQYIPKEKSPYLTYMEHRKRIPVIEVRGKLATSNLNVPSSSQNFVQRTAPRDTSSDDLKLKLKLIELLTNNDGDHETMTNEKASKALKKLLSNTEDASSENETILNWLEQKSEKKKKPKMDISKLIKALNEAAESKTEEDEIEKELKQLQQAINNLRPKDEFQVGKLDDLNSKNIGEDNFQAALNKLLNKKPSNQKPSSSNDAVKTHSFTPEQLLELQELINNQNTISSGINPYTATRPNTVFPQDSYPPFLPYNYRYSTPMARPINLDSYWPQSWPDLNTNYKFNPDFLSGPNINPLSPTYSQNDHNYPPFGYANFLKFGPFGINETPNYKISYNYSPGNDHNPFPNGIGQNQYLDTANPWKFDVNNGMGPDNQLDDGGEGNAGKSYRFFPDPKPNYGDNDERRETSPKSFIGSGLDEPYNHDEIANEYNDQVISDLSSQIQNLETVIQGLNNPNDMETKYDQNAIWNLEHKISNLKGVINSLKSSPSNGSPGYNFNELPANMKPNDIKQNPPYQNLNSLYSLTSQLGPKKDQYSISPTIYKNVNPSQINQQHRNNIISSLLPDETSGKEYLPLNRKTIEGKIRRKKRNIDYREQLPEFLNQKYQPQLHFNISTAQFENPNGLDPDVSHVVDIFKKYVMDDIEKQEQFASGIPRSNTYNDLQHKLNQLKAQLELQKKGNNYFPRHFDINEKTFNKPQDILEKLILKILDKVIGITPSIMKRLFGNLVSNIGNSYVDYNSPLQKIFSNIGASGYFPIIMIKVLETTGTVIQYMRKNRFVTQIGIPGISLALVAGVVLFLIYFYQGDHSYNLITYSDQNGYLNNHDNYQNSYNINRYPERQRKNMDSDASNSIPYFSYYDYSPVNHFVKKSY